MKTKDLLEGLRDFWREYSKVGSGIVGLVILGCFIALAIFGPSVVPFPGATEHWHDINFWKDNPQSAPPAWVNVLPWVTKKGAVSSISHASEAEVEELDGGARLARRSFEYEFRADKAPRDVIVRFTGSGQVPVILEVERPDGVVAEIFRDQFDLASGEPQRISLEGDGAQGVVDMIRQGAPELAASIDFTTIKPTSLLFRKVSETMISAPEPLKGSYRFTLTTLLIGEDSKVEDPLLLVSGDVYGILGTDVAKRDLFTGVIVGIRWALIIGLLTSIITVIAGVVFGVVAAYFGGVVDWLLNRLYEFVYLMPVLPFLIVISAIFKPNIWTLITIICLFFWTGPYKPVYSMALQIREETYIEASRALGSKKWRIIFRHIVPILLPYSFAVMALAIPGVIVYEASVSLLGLGDSSIVTWGQILHDALTQGAVINNLWWWVIPPGLTIALMGMSFAFIGTAMDKILHPKLKTR